MLAISLSAVSAKAQDVKDRNFLNAGIGLGTFGLHGKGGLPIAISYERGFTDKISGGIYLSMVQRKYIDDFKYKYKVIGLRASYHFNELLKVTEDKLDVYGGASLYHRSFVLTYEDFNGGKIKSKSGVVGIGIHAGGRYMVAQKLGVFAEVGYGISPLQLGATLSF